EHVQVLPVCAITEDGLLVVAAVHDVVARGVSLEKLAQDMLAGGVELDERAVLEDHVEHLPCGGAEGDAGGTNAGPQHLDAERAVLSEYARRGNHLEHFPKRADSHAHKRRRWQGWRPWWRRWRW